MKATTALLLAGVGYLVFRETQVHAPTTFTDPFDAIANAAARALRAGESISRDFPQTLMDEPFSLY